MDTIVFQPSASSMSPTTGSGAETCDDDPDVFLALDLAFTFPRGPGMSIYGCCKIGGGTR